VSDHWFELGVLVGYGSIGRAHARVLVERCERLVVVDAAAPGRAAAAADHPGAAVLASLDEVGAEALAAAVVVIATWGPSHADLFDLVVDAGCRRVLCEKPLADSVARGAAMVARAEAAGVALGVNYVRRQGREAEGLRALAEQFDLGPVVNVVAHGGARGLVTNGIHTVELACDLLGGEPDSVVSSARGERINPRSADLSFFGGSAIWTFPDGRELVVSYPLGSSLKEHLFVYHRDAVVVLAGGAEARVLRRPPGDVAAHPAVTFTGPASELLWDQPLPSVLVGDDRIVAALRAVRDADVAALRPEHHVRALGACIGALESGVTGARVTLPVDPDSELGRRRWPIS
jgi:predicted dehydrogenase